MSFQTTAKKKKYHTTPEYARLRKRKEAEAMGLMGYSDSEIAKRLGISEHSVRRYTGGK